MAIPGALQATIRRRGNPFFSPDGQWVGFFADRKLKKVSIQGGAPLTLCDAGEERGASWAPDDTIIFAPNPTSPLLRVPASGGTPQPITALDSKNGEYSHRWPEVLPGGKDILFVQQGASGAEANQQARPSFRLKNPMSLAN
jgi:eukaryotic-like serine/threonine-protein kinase